MPAAVGVVTKLLTGWVVGSRTGVGAAGRLRAGAALVARGEFSNIIAGLVGASVTPASPPPRISTPGSIDIDRLTLISRLRCLRGAAPPGLPEDEFAQVVLFRNWAYSRSTSS